MGATASFGVACTGTRWSKIMYGCSTVPRVAKERYNEEVSTCSNDLVDTSRGGSSSISSRTIESRSDIDTWSWNLDFKHLDFEATSSHQRRDRTREATWLATWLYICVSLHSHRGSYSLTKLMAAARVDALVSATRATSLEPTAQPASDLLLEVGGRGSK